MKCYGHYLRRNMKILALLLVIFPLQKCFAFHYRDQYGLTITYDVTLVSKCRTEEDRFRTILRIGLSDCVRECGLRPLCEALSYRRQVEMCDLFTTTDERNLGNGECIYISATDIKVEKKPCEDCSYGQVCDRHLKDCKYEECSNARINKGVVLGNQKKVNKLIRYKCYHGYRDRNGVQSAVCQENGAWNVTANCTRVCNDLPAINNGTVTLDKINGDLYMDTASVACDTGYKKSADTINCTDSGDWENVTCDPFATDCTQILVAFPNAVSGVYDVKLWQSGQILTVYCDMETDGGGWTVFQRRFDGSVEFYRNFTEYENGFGTAEGEFWLGLKYVQELAEQGPAELRTDMSKADGAEAYETFQYFSLIGPDYVLSIGSRVGTAGDDIYGLKYNNGYPFTAKDSSNSKCANNRIGGWWYYSCTWSNLNGRYYTPGSTSGGASGLTHYGFAGFESMLTSEMMLRRV